MKTLNFRNHTIILTRKDDVYFMTPYYYVDSSGIAQEKMGDIELNKMELAQLIVKLTEMIHG